MNYFLSTLKMDPNNLVCRTCLGIIPAGKSAYDISVENSMLKNVKNIMEMIVFCLPEMDVYVSVNPVVCLSCLASLVTLYNFKTKCMHVEKVIRSYIIKNNLIEGSCVNLNNVVKHQIVESLKKKNWPVEYIDNYVNRVLSVNKPASTAVLPSTASPNMAIGSVSSINPPALVPLSANLAQKQIFPSQNACLPSYTRTINPNIQLQTIKKNVHVNNLQPPQTHTAPPQRKNYLLTALLDTQPVTSGMSSSKVQNVKITPSTSAMTNFQAQFLESLSLKRSDTNPKKVQNRFQHNITGKSNCPNVLPHTAPVTYGTSHCINSNSNKTNVEANLKVNTSGLRTYRKSSGQNKKVIESKQDDVVAVEEESNVRAEDEVLIINFDEDDNSPQPDNKVSSAYKQMIVRIPTLSQEILKHKLTPEVITEEILSKRRRLSVKLNPSLRYLHKNKKLVVKLKKLQILRCQWCPFITSHSNLLSHHESKSHRQCKLCQFKCGRTFHIQKHLVNNHLHELIATLKRFERNNLSYPCYLCGFVGLSDTDLADHRLRMHIKCNESGMYRCPYSTCKVEVAIAHALIYHLEMQHDKIKQYECPLCNYVAPGASKLMSHVEAHSVTQYQCTLCKVVCKSAIQFQKHMEKLHSEPEGQGMVPVQTSNLSDNYSVTLDTLGEGQSCQKSHVSALPQGSSDLSREELGRPSLSEFLCERSMIEGSADVEDCILVDDYSDPGGEKNNTESSMDKDDDCIEIEETVANNQLNEQTLEKVAGCTRLEVTKSVLTTNRSQDIVNVSSLTDKPVDLLDEHFEGQTMEKITVEETQPSSIIEVTRESAGESSIEETNSNLEISTSNIQKEPQHMDKESDVLNLINLDIASKTVSNDQSKNINSAENNHVSVNKESTANPENLQLETAGDAGNLHSLCKTVVEPHNKNLNLEGNNLSSVYSVSAIAEGEANSEELEKNEDVNQSVQLESDVDAHNKTFNIKVTCNADVELENSSGLVPVSKEDNIITKQLDETESFNQLEQQEAEVPNLVSTSMQKKGILQRDRKR